MSRGPGRIQPAIAAAVTAQPHHAFPVEELIAVAFPGVDGIEKKHRVAVLRAAHNVAKRIGWCTTRGSDSSASLTFYNPVALRSTAEKPIVSDGKMTNPGWPDLTDWVSLHQELSECQTIYEQERDVMLKRKQAAAMLAWVVDFLMKFPPFRDDTVHLPLKDLLFFLSDLDRGRDHRWSAPFSVGGINVTTTAQNELKRWVRVANSVLTQNGFEPGEAARHIADGLTRSGRTGRGKHKVRWQTVQRWCREEETQLDREMREKVEQWWRDVRASLPPPIKVVDAS